MTTQIHPDGAHFLEKAANADLRRGSQGGFQRALDCVMVSPSGKFCYSQGSIALKIHTTIYLPHTGDGEPRPQP